jgi:hypothetical protein
LIAKLRTIPSIVIYKVKTFIKLKMSRGYMVKGHERH